MSVFSHYTSMSVGQQRAFLFGRFPFWKDLAMKVHLWFCVPCVRKEDEVLLQACRWAYGIEPDVTEWEFIGEFGEDALQKIKEKEDPWEGVEAIELSPEEKERMKQRLFRQIEEEKLREKME